MIGINLQLFDYVTQQISLAGINALWWDSYDPQYFERPIGKSELVTTDVSGYISLDLSNVTDLTIGDYGFLLLYKADTVDYEDSLVFAGRVQTSDIVSGIDMDEMSANNFDCDFDFIKGIICNGIPIDRVSTQPLQTIELAAGRVGYDGIIVDINEPTLDSVGLLTYGAYKHLVPYSQDTDNWTGSGPWTHVIDLADTGTYTVSTDLDSPTIDITAGTATIDGAAQATYENPDQFVVSGIGTVTITTDTADPKALLTLSTVKLPYFENDTDGSVSVPSNNSNDTGPEGLKWPIGYALPDIDSDNWEEVDGVELLSGWDFTSGWNILGTNTIDSSNSFSGTTAGGVISDNTILEIGKTYRATLVSSTTASLVRLRMGNSGGGDLVTIGTNGVFQFVATEEHLYWRNNDAGASTITVFSIKQIQPSQAWTTCGQNLLNSFDGVADGALEASGNLVAGNRYEIITTEVDHFGAGKVVGDRVTGLTTALDTNNTVKQISTAKGEMHKGLIPRFSYDDTTGTGNITSVDDSTPGWLYHDDDGTINFTDGTNIASVDINYIANNPYLIIPIWGPHPIDTLSAEKMVNGDFADWTTDDPDDWTDINEQGDATSNITENPSEQCQIISDGTLVQFATSGTVIIGVEYSYSIVVSAAASGAVNFYAGGTGDTVVETLDTATTYTGTFVAEAAACHFKRVAACNITLASVSIKATNQPKMQIIVEDLTGAEGPWESSVVDFQGTFSPADHLSLAWENIYPQHFKRIILKKELKSWQ